MLWNIHSILKAEAIYPFNYVLGFEAIWFQKSSGKLTIFKIHNPRSMAAHTEPYQEHLRNIFRALQILEHQA